MPFSRKELFAIIPLAIAAGILGSNARGPNQVAYMAGVAVAGALVFGLFTLAAYSSTRNKLAFKIEASDPARLERPIHHDRNDRDTGAKCGFGSPSSIRGKCCPGSSRRNYAR